MTAIKPAPAARAQPVPMACAQDERKQSALVGFVLNPIAGMGGRVGLKGTDGVVEEARARGARPVSPERAARCLAALAQALAASPAKPTPRWLVAGGAMGADALRAHRLGPFEVVHQPPPEPTREDTLQTVRRFVERSVALVLFCGGDGTARDVCSITGTAVPIIGIPAGVKMYSGVFGVSPTRTAALVAEYLAGSIGLADAEVLDLDEDAYRAGRWEARLFHAARTPFEPSLTQRAKVMSDARSDAEVTAAIAADVRETVQAAPDTLLLLGAGTTVRAVAEGLGVEHTLLGVDAVLAGRVVGRDLDADRLAALLERHPRCLLVLSPIGAQGFVLGRGNAQLAPEIVARIGRGGLVVVATPAKLARTRCLRIDTGDPALDAALVGDGFLEVRVGYHRRRMVRVE
ncbi:MAG: ATP-NAD kinase family protein [Ectothiorhodospiraceae bacterium]|nr:ATP-NAD kinase family protein [Ectothiorhodospiraceae bacterium]